MIPRVLKGGSSPYWGASSAKAAPPRVGHPVGVYCNSEGLLYLHMLFIILWGVVLEVKRPVENF